MRTLRADRLRIERRLAGFVGAVDDEAVFRRLLRYQPGTALRQHGLDVTTLPPGLPVRHRAGEILVNEAQLFGLGASNRVPPPLDARLVAYGVKSAGLVQGEEASLGGLLEWAEHRGLSAVLSPFEWQPVADVGKGGYCNLGGARRPARPGTGSWRSLIIAQDEDFALLAWLALAYQWDELLGTLLGYPSCCAAAFVSRWEDAVTHHQGDLAIPALTASGSPPYDWRLNILGRYFGFELIQHFPCRYDCAAALAVAERHRAALRHYEPDHAARIEHALSAPVIYTERNGLGLLPASLVSVAPDGAWTVSYDPTRCHLTDDEGLLGRAVRRASEITCRPEENHVHVAGQPFEGRLVWFAGVEPSVT